MTGGDRHTTVESGGTKCVKHKPNINLVFCFDLFQTNRPCENFQTCSKHQSLRRTFTGRLSWWCASASEPSSVKTLAATVEKANMKCSWPDQDPFDLEYPSTYLSIDLLIYRSIYLSVCVYDCKITAVCDCSVCTSMRVRNATVFFPFFHEHVITVSPIYPESCFGASLLLFNATQKLVGVFTASKKNESQSGLS